MTRLDESLYERARQFLLKRGRKLEAALFTYEFEQGDPSEVYRQLASFKMPMAVSDLD
jgi:hypothetical protein